MSHSKSVPIVLATLILYAFVPLCLCAFLTGCDTLRLAPSEAQKQIALRTHLNARAVDAGGAEASTPATQQLVQGTGASLDFTGMPGSLEIADYDATLQAAYADAAKRPTTEKVFEAVGEGLSLVGQLAILFGTGGITLGGVKITEWISRARKKSQGLQEIILANKVFLAAVDEQTRGVFKTAQNNRQSTATKKIVAELKV